jgi:hypothetical protein
MTIFDFGNPTRIYTKPTSDVVLPVTPKQHALHQGRLTLRQPQSAPPSPLHVYLLTPFFFCRRPWRETDRTRQDRTVKADTREICTPKISPSQIGAGEVEASQVLISKIYIRQGSTDKVASRIQTCILYK